MLETPTQNLQRQEFESLEMPSIVACAVKFPPLALNGVEFVKLEAMSQSIHVN